MTICDICFCSITTPCRIFVRGGCPHDFCFHCIQGRFLTHSTCPVCREELSLAVREKVGEWDVHEMAIPTQQDRQTTPNRNHCPVTPKKKPTEDTPARPREDVDNSRTHRVPLMNILNPVRRRLFSKEVRFHLLFQ